MSNHLNSRRNCLNKNKNINKIHLSESDGVDLSVAPLLFRSFHQLLPSMNSVAIADMEKFIYYKPSLDIDLKIKHGDSLRNETVTYQAIQEGKRTKEFRSENVFGVGYYAVAQPIRWNKKIIGALTVVYPKEPQLLSIPYLTVRTSDRWIPVHFDNVIYLEALNRKTYVTSLNSPQGTHRYNLTELEMTLPKGSFIRCHRSFIVNIHHVKEIQPDIHSTFILVMSDGSRVPVSQSFTKEVRSILGF